jgi:antitoxin SocA-like protein
MAERLVASDLNVNVTYRVDLSGGQRRLKEAILYVADKSKPMTFFGRVKLNKIIWRADFRSFYGRHQPVTGRSYQKLEWGPALIEMVPVMQGLLREGVLVDEPRIHAGTKEFRPVARADPVLKFFSREDIEYLDESIHHYWDMIGTESSDESHGIAWKSRQIGDLIPYEASYFSDLPLSKTALQKLSEIAVKHNLHSD